MRNKNYISFWNPFDIEFKMFLLTFSVLLIAKVTLGKIDCEDFPGVACQRPEQLDVLPREVSEFNDYCALFKSHLKCLKEWQDECGTDRFIFFQTPEIYEANYDTLTEVCEEGTLLNSIVTENLKCLNETFGRTRCHEEAEEFVEPFIKELRENEALQPKFEIFCLRGALVSDCVVRATSDKCGEIVGEAALEVLRRSKLVENSCSDTEAKSVLRELENLDLSDDKKTSLTQLLERIVAGNSE